MCYYIVMMMSRLVIFKYSTVIHALIVIIVSMFFPVFIVGFILEHIVNKGWMELDVGTFLLVVLSYMSIVLF